jgi:hypothetical protein
VTGFAGSQILLCTPSPLVDGYFFSGFEDRAMSKSFFSCVRKQLSTRFLRILIVLLTIGFITACDDGNDKSSGASLLGMWSSPYGDSYVITSTSFTYDDGYNGGYAGTISNNLNLSASHGVAVFQYTANSYDTDDEKEGWFTAFYWKDLNGSTVQMATATVGSMVDNVWTPGVYEYETWGEAQAALTEDTVDDFVSNWGTYTK